MRKVRTAILAGAATLLVAGAAYAAANKFHTMNVSLPDGAVAQVEYVGDVAPKIEIRPVDARVAVADDPFVELERMQAMMERQHQQMMQQVAEMERMAAQSGGAAPGQVLVSGNMPAGTTVHYTFVSSSNGRASCSETVQWQSDGSGNAPKVTRTSSGDCGAVKHGEGDAAVPVSAPAPAKPRVDPRSI